MKKKRVRVREVLVYELTVGVPDDAGDWDTEKAAEKVFKQNPNAHLLGVEERDFIILEDE